jgi:protein-S-isoprenylcysteine O-methyltransferase Ste14
MLYGAGFWASALIDLARNRPWVPSIVSLGAWLGGDAAINALFFAALLLVVLCFFIRWWGSSYLQSIVWNANAVAKKLYIEGPFCFTRNPLYLGNMFMSIGIGSIAPPEGFIFIVASSALLCNALINHEEPLLRAEFGDAYTQYCARVPRFWPRLRPIPSEGALKPDYSAGFRTELFSLGLALGMCCFLAPMPYGLIGFFAFYFAGIFAQRIATRRMAA